MAIAAALDDAGRRSPWPGRPESALTDAGCRPDDPRRVRCLPLGDRTAGVGRQRHAALAGAVDRGRARLSTRRAVWTWPGRGPAHASGRAGRIFGPWQRHTVLGVG